MTRTAKEPSIEDGHVWLAEYNVDAYDKDMVCIARTREKAQELCQEYENEHASIFNREPESLVFKRQKFFKPGWVWSSAGRRHSKYYWIVAITLDV